MKMKMPYVIGGAAFLFACAIGSGCSRTETSEDGVKPVESSTENHEIKTIEADIVRVPDMVFSLGEENWASLKAILRRIDEVPDPSIRLCLFRSYQDALFSVSFEKAGDIHSKDWKERNYVHAKLGWFYCWMEEFSHDIFWGLINGHATSKDAFEPLFRYLEVMRKEAQRVGSVTRGYPPELEYIERMYGALIKSKSYQPDEFEWVKAEFQKIVGRPIRTLEEVSAARAEKDAFSTKR